MSVEAGRVLSFVAAGVPLVTPLTGVERIVEELAVLRVPFAGTGLVGLLPQDDGFVPLYDVDDFCMGRLALTRSGDFDLCCIMPTPSGRLAIRLDRLRGLVGAATPLAGGEAGLEDLPPALGACIGGVALVDGLMAFYFAPDLFAELVRRAEAL